MMAAGDRTILHGLGSCDTCRKARRALESAGHAVTFRDVRTEPLSAAERSRFLAVFGEYLINRASATWRGLDEVERKAAPEEIIARHPAVMKRPVIERGARLWLGWDARTRAEVLK